MKNLKRKLFVAFLSCLSLFIFASCDGNDTETAENTHDNDTVIVALNMGSEPSGGFDPAANWGSGEHCHEPLIQSTLVTTDVDMNIVNDLATEYSSSSDGLTWTFKIRNDVKFTDGEPLTAQDVAFTYNTIKASPNSEMDLTMMEEAVAVDDTTVEIKLNKPYNAFLYSAAVIGIMPEHAYDKNYAENPIGSGRYMLSQWDKGQQIIFEANPDYYGEAPKMKKVIVLFMEEDAALAAVKSGEVDIAYTSATYSDQTVDGYKLFVAKSVDSRGISLPTLAAGNTKVDGGETYGAGNDVTSDLAIRRAMNYAVDREAMIDNVLNGYGTVAYTVSDGMPWASPDMKVETDVEKAKKILKDGGWEDTDHDGILEKDGLKAELDLYYSADDSVRQAIANEFANQMKEIGIAISPVGASWDDIYPHQYTDMVVWGWGGNSPSEVYNLFYSEGWGNYACYENESVDSSLNSALAASNLDDSYELWQKAQWNEDDGEGVAPQGAATWVWLANVDHLYFAREGLKVAEQKLHPHGHGWSLVNNVDQWTWE